MQSSWYPTCLHDVQKGRHDLHSVIGISLSGNAQRKSKKLQRSSSFSQDSEQTSCRASDPYGAQRPVARPPP